MNIQLSKNLEIYEVLKKIENQPLAFKTSYKLAQLLNSIETNCEFYQTNLAKIIQNYGEYDKNGNLLLSDDKTVIKIEPQYMKEAEVKMNELLNTEVQIIDINLSSEELERLELTIKDTKKIMQIIKEQ